jgi:hypothetical protein
MLRTTIEDGVVIELEIQNVTFVVNGKSGDVMAQIVPMTVGLGFQ